MIKTNLGALNVVEAGNLQGEPLVLWPSIFTDHHIYDGLVKQLGASYRFLLINGPGHGGSEGPKTEFTMADCADAMASILDAYGLDSALIGGTSWGAWSGQNWRCVSQSV